MDGLSGIISSLGQNNNWQKLLTGGMAASGEVGNILEEKKKADYQNFIMGILKNPAKLAQMTAQIQQPLSQGLTQSVDNGVQANLASRGLSQAPGIFAASEGQALAPFIQQNQQTALQAVLQSLGLPAGTFGSPVNTAPAFQAFMNTLKPQTPNIPPPTDTTGNAGFDFPGLVSGTSQQGSS